MAIGYLVSSMFDSFQKAVAVGQLFIMPMTLFGGFIVNSNGYHVYVNWLQYLSPVRYGFEVVVRAQVRDEVAGEAVLAFLGLDVGFWQSIFILSMLIILLRIASIAFLTHA